MQYGFGGSVNVFTYSIIKKCHFNQLEKTSSSHMAVVHSLLCKAVKVSPVGGNDIMVLSILIRHSPIWAPF